MHVGLRCCIIDIFEFFVLLNSQRWRWCDILCLRLTGGRGWGTLGPVKFILVSFFFSGLPAEAVSFSGHLRNTSLKPYRYHNMPGTKFFIYQLQLLLILMQRDQNSEWTTHTVNTFQTVFSKHSTEKL